MSNKRAEKRLNDYIPELFLSLSVSFLLFVYGSVEFFYNNENELYYSITDVLQYMLPVFIASGLVMFSGFVFVRYLNNRIESILFILVFAGLIVLYIQGTFLSSNLPPLDGRKIDWGEYKTETVKSIILIATV